VDVEIIRSARRRKTVQARIVDGVIQVRAPARMSEAQLGRHVNALVTRLERRELAAEIDVEVRAAALAARFRLPRPQSIRWVDNQGSRWGSCSPSDGSVRVSARLAKFPPWVVDYVIVHELAHLAEAGHGAGFWALVNRYPKAERARGFLMAKGMDEATE
jgi:predicted metal-dependent hydrolase